MDTAGDGFFATFARPTEALACAAAIVRGMGPLGLSVRVGLHAGEVETRDGKAAASPSTWPPASWPPRARTRSSPAPPCATSPPGPAGPSPIAGSSTLKGLAEPVHAYALDLAAAPTTLPLGQVGVGSTLRAVTPPRAIGAAAVVVGLVVVLLAAVALAGGGGAHPSPTPTTVAAASATPDGDARSHRARVRMRDRPLWRRSFASARWCRRIGYALARRHTTTHDLPATPTLTVVDPGWSVDGY